MLGWCVSGNDNFIGADKENLHSFVDFYEADCCDLANMSKAIEGCDLLFHARQLHTKDSQFFSNLYYPE